MTIDNLEIKKVSIKHNGINHIGERYGKLIILKWTGKNKTHNSYYLCKCDCGNEKEIQFSSLKRGCTKSCGCTKQSYIYKDPTQSSFNGLLLSYRTGAKTRGINFLLSEEEFKKLTSSSCFYCGKEPKTTLKIQRGKSPYIYNGIDRVDNELGYFTENCVSCCKICNMMKKNLSLDIFLEHVYEICNYSLKIIK